MIAEHLEHLVTASKGAVLSFGGAALLAQASAPDFVLPPWARDSIGMVALFFVGYLLIQERRDHRAHAQQEHAKHLADMEEKNKTILEKEKDQTERLELLYQSRLAEAREYATELDKVRREQAELTQRLYQDFIGHVTGKK